MCLETNKMYLKTGQTYSENNQMSMKISQLYREIMESTPLIPRQRGKILKKAFVIVKAF